MTADEVADELRNAADILRRIPASRLWPAGYRTAWPDAPDQVFEAALVLPAHVVIAATELGLKLDDPDLHRKLVRQGLGHFLPRYREVEVNQRGATPHEVTAMDARLFDWIPLAAKGCAAEIGTARRRILWLRALRVSWRACSKIMHMHPSMCRRLHQAALERVAWSLGLSGKYRMAS